MVMLKIMFLFVFAMAALFSGCVSVEKAKTTGIVIVGMGQSAKYGKCEGAAKDASTMAGILSKYGTPQILVNNQATKANVVNALKVASQNDLMIFFYSGHGGSDPIGDVSGEPDKKNEYLCLYNGYLLDNEIWNIICGAKNRVLLIFDCCHSETMFRSSGIDFSKLIRNDASALPRANLSHIKMLCWSGCGDANYSYGDANGGLLTNAIRDSFDKDRTYNKVWVLTRSKLPSYQRAKKTEIGTGFGGKVFR